MGECATSTEYISKLLRKGAERLEKGDLAGLIQLDQLGSHIVAFNEFHDPLVVVTGLILDFCMFGLRRGVQVSMIRGMLPEEFRKKLEELEGDCKHAGAIVREIADLLESSSEDRERKVIEKCTKLIELGAKYTRLAYHISGIGELREQ